MFVFSLSAIRELYGLHWCAFALPIVVRKQVAERQLQTSAAYQTHDCHIGASSEFPGEVKLLQWTTAKGNLAHQFDFTMRWDVFTGHSEVSSGKKVQQRKSLTTTLGRLMLSELPDPSHLGRSHLSLSLSTLDFTAEHDIIMAWNISLATLSQLSWLCSLSFSWLFPTHQRDEAAKRATVRQALLSTNQNINTIPTLF